MFSLGTEMMYLRRERTVTLIGYLRDEADGWTNGTPDDILENLQVESTAHVDVGQRDQNCHRVAEHLTERKTWTIFTFSIVASNNFTKNIMEISVS
jgi:hypothetical protein